MTETTESRPSLMPADTPDFMAPAWAGCMSWAIGNDELRQAFETGAGHRYVVPKSGIDRMIDEATGHSDAYVKAFIEWANMNVWGSMS